MIKRTYDFPFGCNFMMYSCAKREGTNWYWVHINYSIIATNKTPWQTKKVLALHSFNRMPEKDANYNNNDMISNGQVVASFVSANACFVGNLSASKSREWREVFWQTGPDESCQNTYEYARMAKMQTISTYRILTKSVAVYNTLTLQCQLLIQSSKRRDKHKRKKFIRNLGRPVFINKRTQIVFAHNCSYECTWKHFHNNWTSLANQAPQLLNPW